MTSEELATIKTLLHQDSKGRWWAHIMQNYRYIHIGVFDLKEEAIAAYAEKARELFGNFSLAAKREISSSEIGL